MNYISINSIDGTTRQGFEITNRTQKPKKATLRECFYDDDFNMWNMYTSITPKVTKFYLYKAPKIEY